MKINSVLLQLAMEDLKRMQSEYPEIYEELFESKIEILHSVLEQKLKAINHLDEMKAAKRAVDLMN